MAKLNFGVSPTSVILRVKLLNSSVTTGAGLTGLTSTSTGLIISTIQSGEATATAYTVAGSTVETITTLGTYAAPTATKCRFKEVDATNHKGIYEIQLADARFASTGSLIVSLSGATNLAETDFEVQCTNLAANVTQWSGTNVATPATAGIPDVNTKNINNVVAATPGASGGVLISGSNTGTTTLGAMTVTGALTVSDGVIITASTTNRPGISSTGNGTSTPGAKLIGGSVSGPGLELSGTGTSAALYGYSASGPGGFLLGGTNQPGLRIEGIGNADGLTTIKAGTGVDIRGNITGNLSGTVTTTTNLTTNNDKTGYGLSAAAVQAIWDALTSALTTVGSIGKLIVDNLNATITSRMASYTQPTGFLATTFPTGTVANTTNITAGTITTVTNLTNAPTSGDLTVTMAATVKTQAVAALNTDTYAEPGQGAPAATATLSAKINYLYKAWRNKFTQTSTTYSLYADDTTTVDQKATVSDDGTTLTKGEIATGP